jgi:hypothetical protein
MTNTKDEALQTALEALEKLRTPLRVNTSLDAYDVGRAITAVKQALEQPVQEPVGNVIASVPHLRSISVKLLPEVPVPPAGSLIYTTAPAAQRQWTGLTDEDVYLLANEHLHYQTEGYKVSGVYNLARAIETKLKEKNNG